MLLTGACDREGERQIERDGYTDRKTKRERDECREREQKSNKMGRERARV